MEFKNTSRKDDMISLCYFVIYLLNGCEMPGFNAQMKQLSYEDSCNDAKVFKTVQNLKQNTTLQKLA